MEVLAGHLNASKAHRGGRYRPRHDAQPSSQEGRRKSAAPLTLRLGIFKSKPLTFHAYLALIKIMKNIILIVTALLSINAWAENLSLKKQEPIAFGITDKEGGTLGLKFTPPEEDGWNIKRSGTGVSMKKNGESDDENKEIEGYIMRPDAPIDPISGYVEQIKKNVQEGYAKNPRFKIKALETMADPSKPRCIRLHLLLEDTKPVRTVSHEYTKWSEQYVLSCGLLKYKGMGVELRYYDRYYEPNKDNQLAEKANKIFESVVIDDK
jgi:hypothetical protein